MINVHPKGTPRRIDGTFKNVSGQLQDPTTVTLFVTSPAGVTTGYTSPTVVNDSTGVYHADVQVNEGGKWRYRWEGEGAASVEAAGEHLFYVEPTDFTVPAP